MKRTAGLALFSCCSILSLCSCAVGTGIQGGGVSGGSVVVGHELAKEAVLRAIPTAYVDAARASLHVAYQHTSHGTHVSYGLFGLQDYKSGDAARFGITNDASPPDAPKLDFHDYGVPGAYVDLSTADADWPAWVDQNRAFLDDPANSSINVVMWSWCDITGHDVAGGYLPSMQALIDEYGAGGAKIGTGGGRTRTTPVTFVFMTGHAYQNGGGNLGAGKPKDQADLITAYCAARAYLCLDYWSIDSHDMDGNYYADATDDAHSSSFGAAGGNYNQAWQDSHAEGTDWFHDLSSPGGAVDCGQHESQHITANRKAYAMWYILARIAGWSGSPE